MAGLPGVARAGAVEIEEISTVEAQAGSVGGAALRRRPRADEWDEGHIPGALSTGRGRLEQRIEGVVPRPSAAIVVYCSAGSRSAFAAKTLEELGYERSSTSPAGSATGSGTASRSTSPRVLTPSSAPATAGTSSSRGRRGRPAAAARRARPPRRRGRPRLAASLYLAAAGVGTLGIVDADVVDDSNLQRQIVHSTERLGEPKVLSAKRTIEALNPDVEVVPYQERLTSENVERILADGWDVIVDGADNFPTRYLVNDASVWHGIPVVHGSIYRFEGQVTVFQPAPGPATAASSPRRRRPSSRPAAPRAASSASCRGSSARCRRTRR